MFAKEPWGGAAASKINISTNLHAEEASKEYFPRIMVRYNQYKHMRRVTD